MATPRVINIKCPCCSEILEIEVKTQRVLAHRKGRHLSEDAKGDEDAMDVAFRQQQETKQAAERKFQSAADRMKNESDRFDALFDEARRKAEEEGDEYDPNDPTKGGKLWD